MSALHSESSWNTAQRPTKKCSLFVKHKHYTLAACCLYSMDEPLRTEHNSRRSVFENIFDNCFVTICHFWFQNIFDNFCHFWFENMFDYCFLIICHLSPYLHKSCLISWQNLFMKHLKFVLWQSGGSAPWTPRRGFARGPHRACAPDPRASLRLCSLPRPAHRRMPAIIKFTPAANFNVLIG